MREGDENHLDMVAKVHIYRGGDKKRGHAGRLLESPLLRSGLFSKAIALIAGTFGLLFIVTAGLHLHPPGILGVQVSDSLCFVLLSGSLWLQTARPASPVGIRLSLYASVALGSTVVLVALFSFLRAFIHTGIGTAGPLDLLPRSEIPHFATLGFVLLGLVFTLPKSGKQNRFPFVQLLATASFVCGLLGVLGFDYNPSTRYTGVPVAEGLILIGFSVAALSLHPDRGFVREVFAPRAGGLMARRLLPVAIVVPVLLYWIKYRAQQAGLIGPGADRMLMVIMAVLLLVYFTFVTAQSLNQADEERERKDIALAEANNTLETRVAQRSKELNSSNARLQAELAERKAAEERAVRSERQLRAIFDQIPAAVWTTDGELRIRSASGSARGPSNLPAEALVGMTCQEFFGTQDTKFPPLAAHLAACRGESRSYQYEMAGRTLSVNVQPLRNADGKINGVIGIALDVTETKKLLESAAKLAAIVESSQDAIMGTSLEGIFTSWNQGAEQMYGYTKEEVLGRHVSITVPADRQEEFRRVFEEVKGGGKVAPYETARLRKDGRLVDVSIAVSRVRDAAGNTVGISAIAHDISARVRVEKELRKLSARLLRVQDEARRKLARDMHDTVVQGLAAAVIELTMLDKSQHLLPEERKRVEEALRINEKSLGEIRTFSYLLHPPLLDERGLHSALRWYIEGYNKRSPVQVELDLSEERGRLGREVELALFRFVQEALTNVHRHSGGRHAVIRMRQAASNLTLSVSDDGQGMDPVTLQKVRQKGTALGVGIAGMKERIRQLGGQLKVSSGASGTTLTVILPVEG